VRERILLAAEMAALFAAIPLLFYLRVLPNVPIPVLLGAALLAWIHLRHDADFDRRRLWNLNSARAFLPRILVRAMVFCALIGVGVWLWMPERLFNFVRRAPLVWAVVMVLYPVVSAYAQELLYRAFFFQRYRRLLGQGSAMTLASAALFGFAHIVFGTWIAVALSAAGGVLFARTYRRSGSLALSTIEHALYGDFLFTIGLGEFFYHATRR
jgi:membrane protease YdiL (CAAX protease family)